MVVLTLLIAAAIFIDVSSSFHIDRQWRHRERRQVVSHDRFLWPGGRIIYTVSSLLAGQSRPLYVINQAIQHWEETTCLNFTYIPEERDIGNNQKYIKFEGAPHCTSSVGMNSGVGPQTITLGQECAFTEMLVHELGHAIGLWHEHSRPDRDAHVFVLWSNIQDNREHNFDIQEDSRLITPYDLYSIMHYDPKMFSINKEPTLQTLDPRLVNLIGLHSSLSHYDRMAVNSLYRCAENCPDSLRCENDGFLTSTCTCTCPRGLTGERCEQVETSPGCGGVIDVVNGTTITSPGFPATYRDNQHCVWLLKSPPGTLITLTVNTMSLQEPENKKCVDKLEVRYHSIGVPKGHVMCGEVSNEIFYSVDNKIILNFETDDATNAKGFRGTISIRPETDCASSPCQNGGTCRELRLETTNTYMCRCPERWLGKDCDVPIVDGEWSEWLPWSPCASSCGLQTRTRVCIPAQNGGRPCEGASYEMQRCNAADNCYEAFFCDFGTQRDPNNCNFELENRAASLEWMTTSGKTPSPYTGPSGGHTAGDRTDNYYFLEASTGSEGDKAISWIPMAATNKIGEYCLEFYYNLHGAYIGTLAVVRRSPGSGDRILWQHSGDHGNKWTVARLRLFLNHGVRVGFMAVRGKNYQGDMAIDDISLSPGFCASDRRTRGCRNNEGSRFPVGEFEQTKGCTKKKCFCNRDGFIDCPKSEEKNICSTYGKQYKSSSYYKYMNSGLMTKYRPKQWKRFG